MARYGHYYKNASKYQAQKIITPDGEKFDSKGEYNRWCELCLMQRAGLISALERQVKFELIPKQDGERAVNYIADFVYVEGDKKIVEDFKGFKTDVYILKRKLLRWRYGIEIRESGR